MRKIIFIAISLVSFSDITFAARVVVPSSSPSSPSSHSASWTGFYAGLNGGVVFNNVDLNSNQLGFTNVSGTCDESANSSSFFPGLQLGYTWQVNAKTVLGVEGDYTYNTNQRTTLHCTCPFNSDVSDRFKFTNRQQGSIRARLGYILKEHFLPFISAGGSFANVGLKYSNEGGDYYSTQTTKSGWLVGAGIEWEFLHNWSLRTEYSYADYGKVNLNIPTIYGLNDPNGAGHAKLKTNTVRVAVNYWF